MSRYMIKFYKEGTIRYISHLDLLRLFKRSFKRAGIKLQYSQGFNPHAKMSFAQPLSLGYSSSGEYLEFDTVEPCSTDEILEKVNSIMPEGIGILSCVELPTGGKTLAAMTECADYEITIPLDHCFEGSINDVIEKYMSRDQISVLKHQRKSGKDIEVDIKPMISEIRGMVDDNNIMITSKLAAGSAANLSPEMVLTTFCDFAGIQYDRAEVLIKRTEIYFID
ncbi:MAG TPA: TIGR03936 family radical SAM-associated protein [Anaerovoracaceae bacterium]|nr:TIGR03936 family radical SAM-associated protein [Anaerovoracaceae bacterium]